MQEDDVTLEELSAQTGVEPRTLRSWVSEGLLAPPLKPGRGARYPASNVDRALAIRALKDNHRLSMAEIGRRLMMASAAEIGQWAASMGRGQPGSARGYLRRIGAGRQERVQDPVPRDGRPPPIPAPAERPSRGPAANRARGHDPGELAGIERLIRPLEAVLRSPAPRRSRGTVWTRISVTPDLELSVRGDLDPDERALFEQLADNFRAILSGGNTP